MNWELEAWMTNGVIHVTLEDSWVKYNCQTRTTTGAFRGCTINQLLDAANVLYQWLAQSRVLDDQLGL